MTERDASSPISAGRPCPRCHYARRGDEPVPAWQCPNCQVVYDKYLPPAEELTTSVVRAELCPRRSGSPLPWLALIVLILLTAGVFCYQYFRWPDTDRITLFTSDRCGAPCQQARAFLRTRQVAFTEKNIDARQAHRDRWERVGGDSVPLAFFGEERITGYNQTIYQIALTGFQDRMHNSINQAVILFSAPNCAECDSAIELLRKLQIEFEEYDIQEPENFNVYRELFGQKTPLIFVGNIRLDGYDKEALQLALKMVHLR